MKQIQILFCCLIVSVALYSQAPIPVDNNQHQYIFAIYEYDNSQIFRLDTSSGELSVLKFKGNPEKSRYIKLQGCPEINREDSYYGRFAILQHPKNYYIFLVDHKTGDTWQVEHDALVKIATAQ